MRYRLSSPQVTEVVHRLVDFFFRARSVSALADLLSQHGTRVYPNRLHTLLSDNPNVSVNEGTLASVAAALDTARDDPTPELTRVFRAEIEAKVRAEFGARSSLAIPDPETFPEIATQLGLPPAIVRAVSPPILPSTTASTPAPAATPDWSFQDVAYHRCREALAKGPGRKVGLVIPTGGGKTRVALRILLGELHDDAEGRSVVLWVTHRKRLAAQARRELQAMMNAGTPELPEESVTLLAERVRIIMISNLAGALADTNHPPLLVVIDEAHHAAAPSYLPVFQAAPPVRGLFLTATPVRSDLQSVGIDEVAYTITYRELFNKNVLIEPTFETYNAIGFDWNDERHLADFADYLLEHADGEFTKTLVVASTIPKVLTLHKALLQRLEDLPGHVLGEEDIGWVTGEGSVSQVAPETYLDEFQARPRGVLIATNNLLGEGFDDPQINTVVITYPSSSLVTLMQAAGRCLRYHADKTAAYVVQMVESELSYHFEQRWLYQEISDLLRPQLIDVDYDSATDLSAKIALLLAERHVAPEITQRILARVGDVQEGDRCAILFTGLPYSGTPAEFATTAKWSAVFETPKNSNEFLVVFNEFCARETRVADTAHFLRSYTQPSYAPGSDWLTMNYELLAMQYARRETTGERYSESDNRDYHPSRGTTWLTYVTFRYRPQVPGALREFLQPCVNRDEMTAAFLANRASWSIVVRLELPLDGYMAWLLDTHAAAAFIELRELLVTRVRAAKPEDSFGTIASAMATIDAQPLSYLLLAHIDHFLADEAFCRRSLDLDQFRAIQRN
jgi:superfamily II DNA or RNA helicase